MSIEHHGLVTEFPEHKETIHKLKLGDAHFAKLFDEYHTLDRQIIRVEEDIEPRSDEFLEDLKKRRVQLKDQLYRMVQASN